MPVKKQAERRASLLPPVYVVEEHPTVINLLSSKLSGVFARCCRREDYDALVGRMRRLEYVVEEVRLLLKDTEDMVSDAGMRPSEVADVLAEHRADLQEAYLNVIVPD